MIRRKLGIAVFCFVAVSLVGILVLNFVDFSDQTPPAPPSLNHLEAKTGLIFSPSAKLLYYEEDNERFVGLKRWVVEDLSFSTTSQPYGSVIDSWSSDSLVDMINACIGKGVVTDPVRSFHASFTHGGASFEIDYLETKRTKYIYILKHP